MFMMSMFALVGCALLTLSVSPGRVSAGEATDAVSVRPTLAASCDREDCPREPEPCRGGYASLLNPAVIAAPTVAARYDDTKATSPAEVSPRDVEVVPTGPASPEPHWSHLPIWGTEAQAKGFQIPLPFGIGVNYYREQQPFNINNLKVGIGGRAPVSVDGNPVFLSLPLPGGAVAHKENIKATGRSPATSVRVLPGWAVSRLPTWGTGGISGYPCHESPRSPTAPGWAPDGQC
jgi:hypothetical protein